MLQKNFKLEVKSVEDDGTFTGYASVTGNTDSDNEVIDKGAFRRTLDHTKGVVPILWQHDRAQPVGWNVEASEDGFGLSVKGKLMTDTELGRYAQSFLKTGLSVGAKPGLSIGFTVPKGTDYIKAGVRHFKEVSLKEYSIATFQSNIEASVTAAKEKKIWVGENPEFSDLLAKGSSLSRIADARYDATQKVLDNDQLSADEKKADIAKIHEQYAAVMSEWYSRYIDAKSDNDQEEDTMDEKNEKTGRAISAASADKIKMAMDHISKGTAILQGMYGDNDTNLPNPVGGGKTAKSEQEGDSQDMHSLLEMLRSVADRTKAA